MKFLFSTGSLWSYSIKRCFQFAAAAGFDGLEIVVDSRWESRQGDYLKPLIQRYELPVLAVHSPFMPRLPGWPSDQIGRIHRSVMLAEELEAAVVVHHLPSRLGYVWVQTPERFFPLPVPWSYDSAYRQWLEKEYTGFQAGTQVMLCIENMPAYRRFGRRWNYSRWNSPEELRRFRHLTLDTTHLGTWKLDPQAVYRQLNNRVRHVHLSNYDGREHLPPEMGELQLDRLVAELAVDGFQGAITLELHPEALSAGDPDRDIIARMKASLSICRQWAQT